jgi:hypothetical protein
MLGACLTTKNIGMSLPGKSKPHAPSDEGGLVKATSSLRCLLAPPGGGPRRFSACLSGVLPVTISLNSEQHCRLFSSPADGGKKLHFIIFPQSSNESDDDDYKVP